MNRQSAVSGSEQDRDVLGIARNVGEACIRKLRSVRAGLSALQHFFWKIGERTMRR
jgi:hypothetical protein